MNSFQTLTDVDISAARNHVLLARTIASRIPGVQGPYTSDIRRVTVIGGGLMGTGIAIALLNADIAVTIVESQVEARRKSQALVAATIGRDVDKGRANPEKAALRISALSIVDSMEEATEAELFIEAVFEDIKVKRDVFQSLDKLAGPDAILASNTSTLDLNTIAGFTSRPDKVVGMHFFSPANVMRLVEVVRGEKTSPATLASAMAFAQAVGKTGVVAGVCDGFIGNRIFEEYLRQAWFLLEEGALPLQLDRALEGFGMAMGPCRVMDLAGQDIGWNIRKRRAIEQPDRPYSKVPDILCERGRFGQKKGVGFYRYRDGRTAEVDSEIEELILGESRRIGIERRAITDQEIVDRCIHAMINEGARVLDDGIAFRPVDIDVVYLDGYGFPAQRGGPMFHADRTGLPVVLETIQRFASGRHGWAWEPAELLVELAGRSGTFAELNL